MIPFLDRWAEGPGYVHAHHFPGELKAGVALPRLDPQVHFGELPGAARLLLVAVLFLGRASDRLAVGHPRHGRIQAQAKGLFHAPYGDVDVGVAHARHDRLVGDRVLTPRKRRVLFGQPVQRGADLDRVGLGPGADGHRKEGIGIGRRIEPHRRSNVIQGVPGLGLAQLGHHANIAGRKPGHRDLLLAPNGVDLADPLFTVVVAALAPANRTRACQNRRAGRTSCPRTGRRSS